jgi:hypothetical protein
MTRACPGLSPPRKVLLSTSDRPSDGQSGPNGLTKRRPWAKVLLAPLRRASQA